MHQGDRPDPPPTSALSTSNEQRTCSRCGQPEPRPYTFRHLPGSMHIIVCPACYAVLWGCKDQKGKP